MFQRDPPSERLITCAAPIVQRLSSSLNFLKIECALPIEIPTDSAMQSTNSRRLFMTSLLTFLAVSSLTAVDGRPQRCESSHDDLPRLNSAYRFVTVEYAGADSPNVSFISVKISCGVSP